MALEPILPTFNHLNVGKDLGRARMSKFWTRRAHILHRQKPVILKLDSAMTQKKGAEPNGEYYSWF